MNAGELLSLFLALTVLAALPSSSVALVVVRSARYGVGQGVAAAIGITLGDLLLAALAPAMHGPSSSGSSSAGLDRANTEPQTQGRDLGQLDLVQGATGKLS